MKKPAFNFELGSAQISTNYLNELREIVQELKEKIGEGEEFSNHITDFIFSVESEYQRFYELDENNFEVVHLQ